MATSPNTRDRTLLTYGKALGKWAEIEKALYDWFRYATLLDDRPARAIFYSATAFRGRLDMLDALVDLEQLEAADIEFLEAASKKCIQYSGFRNKLAHGAFSFDGTQILQGKHPYKIARENALALDDLVIAASNFENLADAIQAALFISQGADPPEEEPLSSLEKCLAQVRTLPIEANSRTPAQIISKHKHLQRSSRR